MGGEGRVEGGLMVHCLGKKKKIDSVAYLAQQHGHDGESQQDGAPHIK